MSEIEADNKPGGAVTLGKLAAVLKLRVDDLIWLSKRGAADFRHFAEPVAGIAESVNGSGEGWLRGDLW